MKKPNLLVMAVCGLLCVLMAGGLLRENARNNGLEKELKQIKIEQFETQTQLDSTLKAI